MTDIVAAKSLVETAVSAAMAQVLPAGLADGDPLARRSEHAEQAERAISREHTLWLARRGSV